LKVNICHDDSVAPMNGSSLKDSVVDFSVTGNSNQTEQNQSTIFTPINIAISLAVTSITIPTLVILFKKFFYGKRQTKSITLSGCSAEPDAGALDT